MNTATASPTGSGKRPRIVWAILALYAFGLLISIASLLAVLTHALRLPAGDAAFYAGFGTLNFLGLGLSAILSTVFTIQLFRMRKSAAYLAVANFMLLLVKNVWYQPQLVSLGHSLAPAMIGVLIAFLIVCYTWHLKRSGNLR